MKKLLLILFLANPAWADVTSVKYCPDNQAGCYIVTEGNGFPSTTSEGSRLYRRAQKWIADGGAVTPSDSWESTLAKAKTRRIKEIKREARKIMMENTDWYVIRKAETGTALPAQIQTYRAALRQTTNDAETAINALVSIEEVRLYKPVWPVDPGE